MKILSLSDLHSHDLWDSWIIKSSVSYDTIMFPGDLIDCFNGPLEEQYGGIVELFRQLSEKGKKVAFCSGNHDFGLNEYVKASDLDLSNVTLDGEVLSCMGVGVYSHPYNTPIPSGLEPVDIWLYHVPPEDCPISRDEYGESFGCLELASRIEYAPQELPSVVICGHQHYTDQWYYKTAGTLFLNSGQDLRHHKPHFLEIQIEGADFRATQWPLGESVSTKLTK